MINWLYLDGAIEGTGCIKCILPRPVIKAMLPHLSEQEERVMQLLDLNEQINPQLIIKTLHISRQTTARVLTSLVNKGPLIRKGAGRAIRYSKR